MENVVDSMTSIAKRSIAPVDAETFSKRDMILFEFVNITDKRRAAQFISGWGMPRVGMDAQKCVAWAEKFRWMCLGVSEWAVCEFQLTEILKPWDRLLVHAKFGEVPFHWPAVMIDWRARKLTVRPRDLLDLLAITLLEKVDKIKFCEGKGCPAPYYIATRADQMYCPHGCGKKAQAEKKQAWWNKKENRERYLKKWKRERKQRRLAKAQREKERKRKGARQ